MKVYVLWTLLLLALSTNGVNAREISNLDRGYALDLKAHRLYSEGQYLNASELWTEALEVFKSEKNAMGISAVMVQIAQSQNDLGFPIQACQTLNKLMAFDFQLCDPDQRLEEITVPELPKTHNYVVASISLGNIFRDWGNFDAANIFLNYAIQEAERIDDLNTIVGAKNARANVELVQLKLRRDRFLQNDILNLELDDQVLSSFDLAFKLYEDILEKTDDLDTRIKWLKLYHERVAWDSLLNSRALSFSERREDYDYNLTQLKFDTASFDDSPIHRSRQLLEISTILHSVCKQNVTCDSKNEFLIRSVSAAKEAIEIAKSVDNYLLLSYGYGYLGDLYKSLDRNNLALQAFKEASKFAILGNKPDPLYRWQFEIGNLLKQSGDFVIATQYYDSSIQSISKVELNITPLNREIRTDYQEFVRPIFNTYIAHLLEFESPDFEKALHVRDQLQLSEIKNYLRCGFLDIIPANKITEKDPNAIVINILRLNTKYHVIVSTQNGYHHHSVPNQQIDPEIERLNALFESDSVVIPPISLLTSSLSKLHKALISPALPFIPDKSTILFANDSAIQRIPMAILHDGSKYLIESYRIASIGEKIYEPVPLDREKLNIFFAGVSDSNPLSPDFEALNGVEAEAQAIQRIGRTKSLLNEKFTATSFLANLSKNKIIHVATHGQFSSDPDKTFLAAWDKLITVNVLNDVVRRRVEQGLGPIELLVLSACQTAKGDRKASLGIAGFAIQAGARSTVASLWDSDDEATSLLMRYFYENLNKGESKAESLRNAQLSLLRDSRFENPYYWANFILIGSWL